MSNTKGNNSMSITISEANFKNRAFTQEDFSYVWEITDCTFTNCSFEDINLSNRKFRDCKFIKCDFDGVILQKAAIIRCRFSGCITERMNLDRAFLLNCSTNTGLLSCSAQHTRFDQMMFGDVFIENCNLRSAVFSACLLDYCLFSKNKFDSTTFDYCNMHMVALESLKGAEIVDCRTTEMYIKSGEII